MGDRFRAGTEGKTLNDVVDLHFIKILVIAVDSVTQHKDNGLDTAADYGFYDVAKIYKLILRVAPGDKLIVNDIIAFRRVVGGFV